jgi:hypothetical protein
VRIALQHGKGGAVQEGHKTTDSTDYVRTANARPPQSNHALVTAYDLLRPSEHFQQRLGELQVPEQQRRGICKAVCNAVGLLGLCHICIASNWRFVVTGVTNAVSAAQRGSPLAAVRSTPDTISSQHDAARLAVA